MRKADKNQLIKEFFALAILFGFTSVIIGMSIFNRGALIYYYEPNPIIFIAEVIFGLSALYIASKMIIKIVEKII